MFSTVDNSEGKDISIPKYEHHRLWSFFADKAGNIGKLCTRVGISTELHCDEHIRTPERIVYSLTLKEHLLPGYLLVDFLISHLQDLVKVLPIVSVKFIGQVLDF